LLFLIIKEIILIEDEKVKKIEDKQSFLKLINNTTINKIIFTVREFYLKESILTNEGPIYKVINKYCLKSK